MAGSAEEEPERALPDTMEKERRGFFMKMRNKKWLSLGLAEALALSLGGCGREGDSVSTQGEESTAQ